MESAVMMMMMMMMMLLSIGLDVGMINSQVDHQLISSTTMNDIPLKHVFRGQDRSNEIETRTRNKQEKRERKEERTRNEWSLNAGNAAGNEAVEASFFFPYEGDGAHEI
jgi:hypothetical protein